LRFEANGDLRSLASQLGRRDIGAVNRDEPRLDLLATALAILDRALEAVIDLAAEKILELAAIARRIGGHDHVVGGAGTGEEVLGVKALVVAGNSIEPGGHRGTRLGDALPAVN